MSNQDNMNLTTAVKDIRADKVGETISLYCLFQNLQENKTKAGQIYLSCMGSDSTGVIPMKFWKFGDEINANIRKTIHSNPNDVYYVTATVAEFNGNVELHMSNVQLTNENPAMYLRRIKEDVSQLLAYLYQTIDSMKSPTIKFIVREILNRNEKDFCFYPAAIAMHHNLIGGLILHTSNIVKACQSYQDPYGTINMDLLIGGAILHDIYKIVEYDVAENGSATMSIDGILSSHIMIGHEYVAKFALKASKQLGTRYNEEEVRLLKHMVISHHSKPEYGSPSRPSIPEALLLSTFDDLDARMWSMHEELNQLEKGTFSKRNYHLEASVYKANL